MSKEYPWGKGTPKWTRDAALNDSDKSFTVPVGKRWAVASVVAQLTATATVGGRVVVCTITDGTNIVWVSPRVGAAASATAGLLLGQGHNPSTAARTSLAITNDTNTNVAELPIGMVLNAGYVIRVYDSAAIDAAADDLTVVLHYVEYDA